MCETTSNKASNDTSIPTLATSATEAWIESGKWYGLELKPIVCLKPMPTRAIGITERAVVGRGESSSLRFQLDARMSRVHFAVECNSTGAELEDLGSQNGTFLNGRRIGKKVVLADGDQVIAGTTVFVLRFIRT